MSSPAFLLLVTIAASSALRAQSPTSFSPCPHQVTEPTRPVSEKSSEPLPPALAVQASFQAVARQVFPSVVSVRSYVEDPDAGQPRVVETTGWTLPPRSDEYPGYVLNAAGSGFVVSEEGDVLTCMHHLQKPDGTLARIIDIETPDQRHFLGEVIGLEPTLNLAVLGFAVYSKGYPPKYSVAKLGNSARIASGSWAFGVGDPPGPEKFFGVGLFTTGPSRDCYQELLTAFYLQAAMAAHPEAYGGPVVNIEGEVLGMLSPRKPRPGAQKTGSLRGIEFALPSNIIQGLYKSIKAKRSRRSPWLGYSVISRPELIRKHGLKGFGEMQKPRFGIMLENTFSPGPAEKAGLRPGDWLVRFDGTVINTPVEFQKQLYLAGIGAEVKLEIFREGKTFEVDVTIEERPAHAIQR